MTSVKPLYDHVRAQVLEGLRREWQRYGWEDSEIDDKVDKLARLWAAALNSTGAVTEPPQPQQPAADEAKDEEGADGKRKRKREEKPGEKRFKSGPRVDAPLTYPTFPPAAAAPTGAATLAQPAALPSGYVPRFSSPASSASPPPQPPAATTSTQPNAMQTDGPADAAHPPTSTHPQSQPHSAPPSLPTIAASTTTTPATSQSIKPEPSLLPPLPLPPSITTPLFPSTTTASDPTTNPLLTEPLSVVDDDSDVDVDLAAVKDVVLCQYERVTHQKGRWKVLLRDGIVSVKGKEYAFSRMTGELQW